MAAGSPCLAFSTHFCQKKSRLETFNVLVHLIVRHRENPVMTSGPPVVGYRLLHIRPEQVCKIANLLVASVASCIPPSTNPVSVRLGF